MLSKLDMISGRCPHPRTALAVALPDSGLGRRSAAAITSAWPKLGLGSRVNGRTDGEREGRGRGGRVLCDAI